MSINNSALQSCFENTDSIKANNLLCKKIRYNNHLKNVKLLIDNERVFTQLSNKKLPPPFFSDNQEYIDEYNKIASNFQNATMELIKLTASKEIEKIDSKINEIKYKFNSSDSKICDKLNSLEHESETKQSKGLQCSNSKVLKILENDNNKSFSISKHDHSDKQFEDFNNRVTNQSHSNSLSNTKTKNNNKPPRSKSQPQQNQRQIRYMLPPKNPPHYTHQQTPKLNKHLNYRVPNSVEANNFNNYNNQCTTPNYYYNSGVIPQNTTNQPNSNIRILNNNHYKYNNNNKSAFNHSNSRLHYNVQNQQEQFNNVYSYPTIY